MQFASRFSYRQKEEKKKLEKPGKRKNASIRGCVTITQMLRYYNFEEIRLSNQKPRLYAFGTF